MWVDSHVNLHGERYAEDLDAVLDRAQHAEVGAMLLISDRIDHTDAIAAIAERSDGFSRTIGIHPHHAQDFAGVTAQQLVDLAAATDVVGIGECGLDYHYEYSPRDVQRQVFAAHIEAAQTTGLPLVVHTRNADDDMQAILTEAYNERPFGILLHCYTSGLELMEAGLAMGAYVAFSGILTFKNAEAVRALAAKVPLDRLLIETDCPFLTPVPHRGRRNEPSYVPLVGEALAGVQGVSAEAVKQATTENYFRLFARAARP